MAVDYIISSSIIPINSNDLSPQTFMPGDNAVIPSFDLKSSYTPFIDRIEFYIYDLNKNLLSSDYNLRDWGIKDDNASLTTTDTVSTITLDPLKNCIDNGFNYGKVNTIYNFVKLQLNTNVNSQYFISEISSDRTELRINNNYANNTQISSSFSEFNTEVLQSTYFDEFYLNFGKNQYYIGINAQLDRSTPSNFGILIKLYEPLPNSYNVKDEFFVVTKVGESVGYQVKFEEEVLFPDNLIQIGGPNTNLTLQKEVNNSTIYKSEEDIINTPLTSSYYQLQTLINRNEIEINVDYTEFSDFIFFSSAKQRLENFNYKAGLIESIQNDLNTLVAITGSTTGSSYWSESIASGSRKIDNIIKNFDGFDYFLYYNSESKAWPKSTSQPPFVLYSTGSTQALNWLGSDVLTSIYYGGQIYSASFYDNENQNNLIYSIPEFIRDDVDNTNYDLFINMMGQHFDNLWLYTNNITTKLDADNRLEYGVSKDLVADVLRSLGTKLYSGNFTMENIYSSLLGITPSGSFLPPTGSELITNYVTASGDPIPLDDANKEIYKRLYHNLPYLLKKKGTLAGIKALITIYGIPDTILRISEFGGKDKDNFDDYDYFYNRYSYAFKTQNSASVVVPWVLQPQSLAAYVDLGYWDAFYTADQASSGADSPDGFSLPNTIQFRFKTPGIPNPNRYSQSIFVVKNPSLESTEESQSFDFGVFLTYTGSAYDSGSYTGSIVNPYYQYGNLEFIANTATNTYTSDNFTLTVVQTATNTVRIDYVSNIAFTSYKIQLINNNGIPSMPNISSATDATGLPMLVNNGTYSVIGINTSGASLPAGSGTLCNITFPSDISSFFSTPFQGNILKVGRMVGTTISTAGTGNGGDVTGDGSVSVLDMIPMINGLLETQGLTGASAEAWNYPPAATAAGNMSGEDGVENLYGLIWMIFNPGPVDAFANYEDITPIKECVSCSVYLPFYDGKWWSGMVTRNKPSGSITGTYTLYAGNNIYNGWDGDKIGFTGSCSLTDGYNDFWTNYITSSISERNGLWLGGYISGSMCGTRVLHPTNSIFSGSFQELRYSVARLSEGIFNDFVMNPESIEGTALTGKKIDSNELSSFNAISFRAALGNELENKYTSSITTFHSAFFKSIHPAVTASSPLLIEPSFIYSGSGGWTSSSLYEVLWEDGCSTGNYINDNYETYYLDQPVVGVKNRITDKIKMVSNDNYGTILSNQISIQQNYPKSESYIRDINQLEVAFSPQNEINDDIIQTYGYFDIGKFIGDPRYLSSSNTSYTDLDKFRDIYFQKYYKDYDWYDYVRLIKYLDNSLFKMIKDYVPARTSLSTGVVIKQHLLERNRVRPPQVSNSFEQLTSSIDAYGFDGGAGGSVNIYNNGSISSSYFKAPGSINVTQSWSESYSTPTGTVVLLHQDQTEFYDGTYSGSTVLATTQSLNPGNTYKFTGSGSMDTPAGMINIPFDNSDYQAILNNANDIRKDKFYYQLDYAQNAQIPTNFGLIISKSIGEIDTFPTSGLAETPESNYTAQSSTLPKYQGVKLTSLNYNTYNYTGSFTSSFNNDIFYWEGDESYGLTAVIDKHPGYFAHFTKAIPTPERTDTLTCNIDYLIPSDAEVSENIVSIGQIPGILKVNGDGTYQYITSNNFEHGRKCGIDFTQDLTTSSYGEVNWGSLENKTYTIIQGGSQYKAIFGNQLGMTLGNLSSLQMTNSISFHRGDTSVIATQFTGSVNVPVPPYGNGLEPYFSTSSGGPNTITFKGDRVAAPNPSGTTSDTWGLAHVLNQNYLKYINYNSYFKNNPYYIWDPDDESGYNDFNMDSLILNGDVIRLVGLTGSVGQFYMPLYFTVTGTPASYFAAHTVRVEPNPQDFDLLPVSSSQFTVLRREDQDNRVTLSVPFIANENGNSTPSSDGFLIPEDFTIENKAKVGKLITILKGNNVFT